ncbi:MAG: hypothetical protein ACXQS6_02320 [Candidatus Syntropharchaeales archaeon]
MSENIEQEEEVNAISDERKQLVKDIMDELGLKGGKIKRVILQFAEEHNDNREKIIFDAKRAFIAEINKSKKE